MQACVCVCCLGVYLEMTSVNMEMVGRDVECSSVCVCCAAIKPFVMMSPQVCELLYISPSLLPPSLPPPSLPPSLPPSAFQTEGKLYLVLEFLRGGDLFTRLSKEVRGNVSVTAVFPGRVLGTGGP